MNDEEIKQILNDPKKLLDFFRIFHRLIHMYEAQEMMKSTQKKAGEKVGLSDDIEVKVIHNQTQLNNQEDKQ